MLAGSMNPLKQWPRIKRAKPGVLRVKGRYISTGQWFILRMVAIVVVMLLVTSALAAALLPWVAILDTYVSDTNPISWWINLITDFRLWLRTTLTEDYPAVGKAIWYSGTNPFDWHLLVVWLVLIMLRRPLRYGIAASLATLLQPFLGRKFKVSFTRETITIHQWLGLRSQKLNRHTATGGEAAFRIAPPQYQGGVIRWLMLIRVLQPSQDNELILVQAVAGLRPIKIATPRKMLDAEKIVQSLSLALKLSRDMME